jgi:hypothetical protein
MPTASKTSKSRLRTTKRRRAEPSPYVYVYCAVRGAVNARALRKLPALPDGDHPRVLILASDISLVVADVPATAYGARQIEGRLDDLEWVGRAGAAHHAVADTLVARHTVVPLRPFTLFSSESRARGAFLSLSRELDAALDRVSGKSEWVLRISKPDPALSGDGNRRPESPAPASGTAFLAQKAAAKRATADLAVRVRRAAAALFDAMAALAHQADRRRPQPGTGLLLDAAFLVETRQSTRFKRALENEAKGLLRDGCRISLTGPWPPYSFVALEPGDRRD